MMHAFQPLGQAQHLLTGRSLPAAVGWAVCPASCWLVGPAAAGSSALEGSRRSWPRAAAGTPLQRNPYAWFRMKNPGVWKALHHGGINQTMQRLTSIAAAPHACCAPHSVHKCTGVLQQASSNKAACWLGRWAAHTGRLNTCCQGNQSLHSAGLWWVELHNPVHVWDVQAPCSHIRAQQHACSNAKGAPAAVSSACIERRRRYSTCKQHLVPSAQHKRTTCPTVPLQKLTAWQRGRPASFCRAEHSLRAACTVVVVAARLQEGSTWRRCEKPQQVVLASGRARGCNTSTG